MFFNYKKIGLTLLASSAAILAACSPPELDSSSSSNEETLVDGNEIELVYVPWDSELASTHVIGEVLENAGFDVTLTSTDSPFMWSAIANGEADATVSVWLPNMHAPDYEEYQDQVDHIGTNYVDAATGLVVPSYVEADSIGDLPSEGERSVVSIEAGAGLAETTQEALNHYGLDNWSVQTSSSGAMVTELENAINNNDNIAVTGWEPHWMFQSLDVKMLEDPDKIFGESENIETFGRLGLEEDNPIAYSILENFQWEQEDIGSVMLDIQEGATPEEAAETWVEENQDLVSEWTAEAEEMAGNSSS